jgi:hypothetical protein
MPDPPPYYHQYGDYEREAAKASEQKTHVVPPTVKPMVSPAVWPVVPPVVPPVETPVVASEVPLSKVSPREMAAQAAMKRSEERTKQKAPEARGNSL